MTAPPYPVLAEPGQVVVCTAAELLEAGTCSPRCLLARSAGPCGCPCGGRWHGALAAADVGDGLTPERRAGRRGQAS